MSKLTGQPIYFNTAKRALVETYRRRSAIGLVGDSLNVQTGHWLCADSHISGGIDSYYEYLWKCWKLFGDRDCLDMWNNSLVAINRYLADDANGELRYGHADMNTGKRTSTEYGALDAFFASVLVFAHQLDPAQRLQDSSLKMWTLNGIEPELIDYRSMAIKDPRYALRPAIVESTYYLYGLSGDPSYRSMGRTLFRDFVKYCPTDGGYAVLESVVTKQQGNAMQSFVFAETFKYFYLLLAPPPTLNFDGVVFNTEAHPLARIPIRNHRTR